MYQYASLETPLGYRVKTEDLYAAVVGDSTIPRFPKLDE